MNVYCLFCETGKSKYVMRAAEIIFGCYTLSPRQIQHTWRKGKMTDIPRDLLPGYVFLYLEEDVLEPSRLLQIPSVIRCLRDSSGTFELRDYDKRFALMLLEKDGIIGKTPVYEEKDRIRLTEGAFAGLKATILKVDHRAHRMQIEIPFAGRLVKTWVEYEIVTPEEKQTQPYITGGEESDGENSEHG